MPTDFYEAAPLPKLSAERFSHALSTHFSLLEASDAPHVYGMPLLLATLEDILRRYADVPLEASKHAHSACRLSAALFMEAVCLLCEEARALAVSPRVLVRVEKECALFTVCHGAPPIPQKRFSLICRALTAAGCELLPAESAVELRFAIPYFRAGETALHANTDALYREINRFYLLLSQRPA